VLVLHGLEEDGEKGKLQGVELVRLLRIFQIFLVVVRPSPQLSFDVDSGRHRAALSDFGKLSLYAVRALWARKALSVEASPRVEVAHGVEGRGIFPAGDRLKINVVHRLDDLRPRDIVVVVVQP